MFKINILYHSYLLHKIKILNFKSLILASSGSTCTKLFSIFLISYFCISKVEAKIGDTYFCEDQKFIINEEQKITELPRYKFFMRWSKNHSQVKFVGETWREKDNIVFQNEYSFLSWEIDPLDGSGVSTSSFNEKNKENILYVRTHVDKGFAGMAISKCYKQ